MIVSQQAKTHIHSYYKHLSSGHAAEVSMFGLIASILLFAGIGWLIRFMAGMNILWVSPPENMYGLITTKSNNADASKGGGRIVAVAHAVSGKRIVCDDADQQKWHFVDGEESRGLLFRLLGVIWIGPYRTLRTNKVRTFRWGREDAETAYRLMSKDLEAQWVFFSGQHDLEVKNAETAGNFQLDFIFNLLYQDTYPVRARLKVADSNAVLSVMVEERVIGFTGSKKPEEFLGGDPAVKNALVVDLEKVSGSREGGRLSTEDAVGQTVTSVNLVSVDADAASLKLFELKATTEREMEAALVQATQQVSIAEQEAKKAVATAEGAKKVTILANDAQADHIVRVIKPLSDIPNGPAIRFAEAYENNKTVTTFVVGEGVAKLIGAK